MRESEREPHLPSMSFPGNISTSCMVLGLIWVTQYLGGGEVMEYSEIMHKNITLMINEQVSLNRAKVPYLKLQLTV